MRYPAHAYSSKTITCAEFGGYASSIIIEISRTRYDILQITMDITFMDTTGRIEKMKEEGIMMGDVS
ncbi:MAG: hypothetical protein E6410_10595, partial [Bifidobacterium dentium]|nr:hypothetical protein [Bifidobacterium dentium]